MTAHRFLGLVGFAVFCLGAAGHPAVAAETAVTPLARQYVLAEEAFRAGDLTQAEQLYSKILEAHGDEPTAWFRIGLIHQRQQSFKAALNAYDHALACAPADSSEPITQVLAKVRFNRALLLLESAANDLRAIAPGILDQELDLTRETLTAHLDAALRVAGSEISMDPPTSVVEQKSANGYVHDVEPVVLTAPPLGDRHR